MLKKAKNSNAGDKVDIYDSIVNPAQKYWHRNGRFNI